MQTRRIGKSRSIPKTARRQHLYPNMAFLSSHTWSLVYVTPRDFRASHQFVLNRLNWKITLAFFDDVLILGTTAETLLDNLRQVFERFQQYGLKFNPRKCEFFRQNVEFLGRSISSTGVEMSDQYIDTVKEWPNPPNTKAVERFLGFGNYHRNFIARFFEIAAPLYAVTGKASFRWGEAQQPSFDALIERLTSPSVLAIPTTDGNFILDTARQTLPLAGS